MKEFEIRWTSKLKLESELFKASVVETLRSFILTLLESFWLMMLVRVAPTPSGYQRLNGTSFPLNLQTSDAGKKS